MEYPPARVLCRGSSLIRRKAVVNLAQGAQSEEVELDHADIFKHLEVKLRCDAVILILEEGDVIGQRTI